MPQRIFLTVVVLGFLFCGKIFAQQKNVEKFPLKTEELLVPSKKISLNGFVFPAKKQK